jgi:Flp pilus assembly protein TadG
MALRGNKRFCRGAATVEAALVFPLLLTLTLGVIEYGWLFLKSQQITNASRQAARIAIRPASGNDDAIATVDDLMAAAGLADSGYTIEVSPADIGNLDAGEALTVRVVVPAANVALMNVSILPLPENLGAAVTMSKEGP